MKRFLSATLLFASASMAIAAEPLVSLEAGFANPPAQASPWCYYYWVSDNISKEGITKDLEAMKRVGIGEALIGNIFLDNQPAGRIKVLSEEWWGLVEHAIREGGRIGVNIGLFNCPGWSQSGGPWISSDKTMRYLASSETRVTGPKHLSVKLATPAEPFQDVEVIAFPSPKNDADSLSAYSPRISVKPAVKDAGKLVDGDLSSSTAITGGPVDKSGPVTISIDLNASLTARSLRIYPTEQAFGADCELQVQTEDGGFKTIRSFKCDRSNPKLNTGFMPLGPVTVSFPAVESSKFQLVFSKFIGRGAKASLAEIELSGASRLESYVEKQLGEMHPTPLPDWDTYLWKTQPEPETRDLTVAPSDVKNVSSHLAPDGTFTWDVPAGEWVIQRLGMTPTGMKNAPASPEGQGYEVDKMNRKLTQEHFAAFVGQLLKRMPAEDRKAFKHVVADSYEMGSQNWTDGIAQDFRKQYGYDPEPWLPVLGGRIVGSATQSDRFLWDLRRLVADRVATEYVGGLREASNEHGLGLWLENYGHWGFPGEFLKYGSRSDRIGGEFWVTGTLGSVECRDASSCANIYGKPFVSAESFTGGPSFQNAPRALKARGDWSFCEGINHVVLHVYIQQPSDEKVPGINAPWGTEFNRHNTWFEQGKAWVDYERRSCWLLQQGWRATDVAYFIGEDAPKMSGIRNPELPAGRDFDYINAEVIEKDLSVKDGKLTLPHGVNYQVLVLPEQETMRPELLRKIRDLVMAGATVIGKPPSKSPSMENFPKADAAVRDLAKEIWGGADVSTPGEHKLGLGRVIWGKDLTKFFAEMKLSPDIEYRNVAKDAGFLYTHRSSKNAEIYFVSNQKDRVETVDCAFRVSGMQPELWDAVTGERRLLTQWSESNGQTIVPLRFEPTQSWFVVFRNPGPAPAAGERNFPGLEKLTTLDGKWDVAFDPKWGGPKEVKFEKLVDWTTRPEEGVRYYSGTAVYRKTFDLSVVPKTGLILDLGDVRDVAKVRVNGKDLGVLWLAPWRVDISDAVKPGKNTLQIQVTNPWNNRLVGDSSLPVEKRRTSISLQTVTPKTPLIPAGLLGPVTLKTTGDAE